MSKYVCIGDIHGRHDLLEDLLAQIAASPYAAWRKVFLGDMIDRGPQSFKVVETVKALNEDGAIAILGNHEDMMLSWINRPESYDAETLWKWNGGDKTQKSYEGVLKSYGSALFVEAFRRHAHYEWLKKLPLFYETDEVWFSHAPVCKEQYTGAGNVAKGYRNDRHGLLWNWHGNAGVTEERFAKDLGKLQVVGHVAACREQIWVPRVYKHIVYADTGCGLTEIAPLSAVMIENGVHVNTIQAIDPKPRRWISKPLWQEGN